MPTELAGWLRTPPDLASPPRDELVMKVLVALRVPGTDVHEVIQVAPALPGRADAAVDPLKEAEAESDLGLALVVDAELFRLDAVIRWLDTADGRLKRAAAEPPQPAPVALPRLRRRGGAVMSRPKSTTNGDGAMTVLELRDVSKIYGEGAAEVQRAAASRPDRRGRARWWR